MAVSWKMDVGINNVPAYQVSGRPFVTGALDATYAIGLNFPYVTRWVQVSNHGANAVKIGFSENGVSGSNYVRLRGTSESPKTAPSTVRLELKVSELWLWGSNSVDVVAGLTTIPPDRTSMGTGLPSWSGSSGVG